MYVPIAFIFLSWGGWGWLLVPSRSLSPKTNRENKNKRYGREKRKDIKERKGNIYASDYADLVGTV